MKINDIKHNHSLTDLLKVLLFSILMLAPFLSVAVRCLYVICNKNAYQNYSDSGHTTYETTDYIDTNEYYHFNNEESLYPEEQIIYITAIENLNTEYIGEPDLNNDSYIDFHEIQIGQLRIMECDLHYEGTLYQNFIGQFDFKPDDYYSVYENTVFFTKLEIPGYLDNVFEYSISKLADDQLFNWTEQTAIFSPIESMTSNLGITSPVIPIILVYWFLLSVIYVIIDIILKSFTALTHMLGSKKA